MALVSTESMTPNTSVSFLLIFSSIAMAMVLTLIPLPNWLAIGRPAFFAATVVFWALMQPRSFGVTSAWVCGLFLDTSYSTPLGEHALALAAAAFLVYRFKDLYWSLPLIQQGIALLPVFALYEFVLFWIDGVGNRDVDLLWRWLPVVSTAIIWPIWVLVLERFAAIEVKS